MLRGGWAVGGGNGNGVRWELVCHRVRLAGVDFPPSRVWWEESRPAWDTIETRLASRQLGAGRRRAGGQRRQIKTMPSSVLRPPSRRDHGR